MCTVMATCPEKLVQHLINKKSVDSIGKSYLLDLKKFAITLHFYSPETYELIQRVYGLCLPHPRVISMWYQQPRGWPGITQTSVNMIKSNETMNQLFWGLLVYEVKIQENTPPRHQIDTTNATCSGYADVGNNLQGEHIDIANEALIITVITITSPIKIPFGIFFGKNFTASQKATLIKVCIDRLSALDLRVISVTLNGIISSSNLAGALGANIDTAPFQPYFMHNERKYYLIIDAKNVPKLMKELFVQQRFLDHNEGVIEYTYVQELYNNRNELQIKNRSVFYLWNNSVAAGIERMQREVMFPNLGDSRATVTFIRYMSKMLYICGIRSNISIKNNKSFHNLIVKLYEYIQSLKYSNGDLIINSSNNFVFNTMLCNLYVLQCLNTDYIKTRQLERLPTGRLVLNNFKEFSKNPNFTAMDLSSTYDRLIEKAREDLRKENGGLLSRILSFLINDRKMLDN